MTEPTIDVTGAVRSHISHPKFDVCEKRYVFNAEATAPFNPAERCPAYNVPQDIAAAVRDRQRRDNIQTAELISRGTPTVPVTTGIDGGMNPVFLAAVKSHGLGATIRTGSGTIPEYVNPPAEPPQTATGGLASAEYSSLPPAGSSSPPPVMMSQFIASARGATDRGGYASNGFFIGQAG